MRITSKGRNLLMGTAIVGLLAAGGLASTAELDAERTTQSTTPNIQRTTSTNDTIPRCINDDYNDGTQALCQTETTDHQVLVIDSSDTVVSP